MKYFNIFYECINLTEYINFIVHSQIHYNYAYIKYIVFRITPLVNTKYHLYQV